jgi:xanthine dehydrogenase accessory factor
MNKQLVIWNLMYKSLQQNIPVMLLYVLESKGSSPGRQGFFMCVNADGEMEGSIGGGIMEHKFVELAKEKLKEENQEHAAIRKQIHDKAAAKNQSGMICSGEQTIVLYKIKKEEINDVKQIIECLEQNKNGSLQLSNDKLSFSKNIPENDFLFEMKDEEDWLYEEKIGYKNHLYIIGGGHCSLAFSKLMCDMDFYIHLFDNRENLKTFLQNNYVHEKEIVNDYSELKNKIPSAKNSYVVVMTFGYRTDDVAVRALLGKQFKYFGLLGSKKKIEKMFTEYGEEGIDENLLNEIYSPIGIQIKSETPEEIAVSIAAEIISVKNNSC